MINLKKNNALDELDAYFKPTVDLVVGIKTTGDVKPPFESPHWKILKNHIIIEKEHIPEELDIEAIPVSHYFRMRVKTTFMKGRGALDWCDNWGNELKYINEDEMVTSSPCIAVLFKKTDGADDTYELTLEKYRINTKTGRLQVGNIFYEKVHFPAGTAADTVMARFMERSEDLKDVQENIHNTMRLMWQDDEL